MSALFLPHEPMVATASVPQTRGFFAEAENYPTAALRKGGDDRIDRVICA